MLLVLFSKLSQGIARFSPLSKPSSARMRSGCHLNKRKKHPNAAQLLERGSTNWALGP
jgi:hypothetical protein